MVVATDVEKRIQKLIRLAAKELRIEGVFLFGSIAKGDSHVWSDIDLAIISPDFIGDSFEDSKKLLPYVLMVDTAFEVHTFRPVDFTSNNPFVKEIMTTGIRIL
ncbi:MAG: nucleotidyltransferase domain-containing protein [bacterium]